jgi:hypothetical protein
MRVGFIILGAAIAFCLLVFVSPMSFLGVTCFAIGVGGGGCIPSGVYYGAWFLAVGTIGFGLLPLFGFTAGRHTNIGGDEVKLDSQKWRALVDLDTEIAQVAASIRGKYGPKYESILAMKYLALNDKQYLKAAAEKVIEQAEYDNKQPKTGQCGKLKFERSGDGKYVIVSVRWHGRTFSSYQELEKFARSSAA